MTDTMQQVFPSRLDSLPVTGAFIAAFCEARGVAQGDALRLTLMVEELLTNTVLHGHRGHRGDCGAPVRLQLLLVGESIVLHYDDCAPPFDLRQHLDATRPELNVETERREPGGLGLHLVLQMAQSLDYRYVNGENRLRIVLLRQG